MPGTSGPNHKATYYSTIQQSSLLENEKYYWGYQYLLARDVIVPEMMARGVFAPGMNVAEIGCGEAGVLHAFIEQGAENALGTDIATYRLGVSDSIAQLLGIHQTLSEHDIINTPPRDEWRNAFDLVILRDVIEHLDDTEVALRNIRQIIKPGGYLYVTFPPYSSPFGGHQQLLQNTWGKIPYIHLLPKSIFSPMIHTSKRTADIEEVERLRNIRLSAKKFMSAAKGADYSMIHDDYYLLRPVFKAKFGLPTITITALKSLPLITSVFSMEAAYLLRKDTV